MPVLLHLCVIITSHLTVDVPRDVSIQLVVCLLSAVVAIKLCHEWKRCKHMSHTSMIMEMLSMSICSLSYTSYKDSQLDHSQLEDVWLCWPVSIFLCLTVCRCCQLSKSACY